MNNNLLISRLETVKDKLRKNRNIEAFAMLCDLQLDLEESEKK